MVFSKRELEGYVLIDHRDSPGLTEEQASRFLSQNVPVSRGMRFEGATITCSHCQRVIVMNPDRTRGRGYCSNCDHYICDQCDDARTHTGYIHKSFKQIIDEFHEQAILKGT